MRILYGIQGTGNGHITRARVMAKHFVKQDIKVDYFFSGREESQFFDMGIFGDYRVKGGLSFTTKQGKIDKFNTFKKLRLGTFYKDVKALKVSDYDLVLNDFEPITAWAAKGTRTPVIAMSHQASFIYPDVPSVGCSYVHKQFIKQFAPADLYLGVHWQPFNKYIIPPFIPYELDEVSNPVVDNKVMVYLPFEALLNIIEVLNDFPGYEFYCYHPDAEDQSFQNVHLRKPSRDAFIKDLINSNAVIANAGFELSSEALKLGKKVLLKPLAGQFEQYSNLHTLEEMGLASRMNYLSGDAVEEFLTQENNTPINFPKDPYLLINWLKSKQYNEVDDLHHRLWATKSNVYSDVA